MIRALSIVSLCLISFATIGVFAEPILLRGIIENGSLLLQRADSQFLQRIEEALATGTGASIRGSIGSFLETQLATGSGGPTSATVIFDPVGTEQVLLAPIFLKDTMIKQIQENSEAIMKVLLPKNVAEAVDTANWSQVVSRLSGLRFDKLRDRVSEEISPIFQAVAPEGVLLQGLSNIVSGDVIFGTLQRFGLSV